MNISNQLFQPMLERLEKEYQELSEVTLESYIPEALEVRNFVQKKLRQLELVRVSLAYMSSGEEIFGAQTALRDTLRQHKLELRFARRKWKRQTVSQQKSRRHQERSAHVPTFAA